MWANEQLKKMKLDEKIRFLSGKNWWETVDFPEYGIPSIFLADGPCGLRKQEGEGDHLGIHKSVPATATVSGACLAATWSDSCARMNGQIIGEEAAEAGVDVLLAPALNLMRSPLCGRNFEYFSEDPLLTGRIASAYANGVQEAGVGCCLKHYAVNNQETEREYINAAIDERTLRELYLPGFEMAVKDAHPLSVMSALNQINGVYGAENFHLLTEILREEWGFDGFTVSDWFGIVHPAKAVEAGMDLDMPYSNGIGAQKIRAAYDAGTLSEEAIDQCCLHLLNAIDRIQSMKKNRTTESRSTLHKKHHEMCRDIAREGIVLLKNENILPLTAGQSIGMIGLCAKEPRDTLSGSARVIRTALDVPCDFLNQYAAENGSSCSYAQGYELLSSGTQTDSVSASTDDDLTLEALSLAKACDTVLFFMGQPEDVEMEGHDRKNILLPENQERLLQKVLEINPRTVVILQNASPVAMPWHDQTAAILECFMAGQGIGAALADILFGKVNPSGKLPMSFTQRLEDTSAYFHFPGNKREVSYGEGVFVGYRYYDIKKTQLLYPFGHGLSYTSFMYTDLKLEHPVFAANQETISVSVQIKNTGDMDGAEVIQLYVGMFDDVVRRPEKELKGFQKVFLKAREEKVVTFTLDKRAFAFYYEEYQEWYAPEGDYTILVGASSQDIRLQSTLHVIPERAHKKSVSGWSTVGALRETPEGEDIWKKLKTHLDQSIPAADDNLFASMLTEEKINQMPLRFLNLISNGQIDNDELLQFIARANKTR
ncbi:MAG: glycoside hydrolase family 3 C-terminal domain-containing protein [Clostridiales bacterium]|nr:glycoside hydrolase family 3 C-terminal domain-containing protein [Clostridiales bacterium]